MLGLFDLVLHIPEDVLLHPSKDTIPRALPKTLFLLVDKCQRGKGGNLFSKLAEKERSNQPLLSNELEVAHKMPPIGISSDALDDLDQKLRGEQRPLVVVAVLAAVKDVAVPYPPELVGQVLEGNQLVCSETRKGFACQRLSDGDHRGLVALQPLQPGFGQVCPQSAHDVSQTFDLSNVEHVDQVRVQDTSARGRGILQQGFDLSLGISVGGIPGRKGDWKHQIFERGDRELNQGGHNLHRSKNEHSSNVQKQEIKAMLTIPTWFFRASRCVLFSPEKERKASNLYICWKRGRSQ